LYRGGTVCIIISSHNRLECRCRNRFHSRLHRGRARRCGSRRSAYIRQQTILQNIDDILGIDSIHGVTHSPLAQTPQMARRTSQSDCVRCTTRFRNVDGIVINALVIKQLFQFRVVMPLTAHVMDMCSGRVVARRHCNHLLDRARIIKMRHHFLQCLCQFTLSPPTRHTMSLSPNVLHVVTHIILIHFVLKSHHHSSAAVRIKLHGLHSSRCVVVVQKGRHHFANAFQQFITFILRETA